jgi:hypothetical protein
MARHLFLILVCRSPVLILDRFIICWVYSFARAVPRASSSSDSFSLVAHAPQAATSRVHTLPRPMRREQPGNPTPPVPPAIKLRLACAAPSGDGAGRGRGRVGRGGGWGASQKHRTLAWGRAPGTPGTARSACRWPMLRPCWPLPRLAPGHPLPFCWGPHPRAWQAWPPLLAWVRGTGPATGPAASFRKGKCSAANAHQHG